MSRRDREHPDRVEVPRRLGGPTVNLLTDVLRDARSSGSWFVLLVLVLVLVVAAIATFGQTVLPWAIYPAL